MINAEFDKIIKLRDQQGNIVAAILHDQETHTEVFYRLDKIMFDEIEELLKTHNFKYEKPH